jgi:hypothetical protein
LTIYSCNNQTNQPDYKGEIEKLHSEIHQLDSINLVLLNNLEEKKTDVYKNENFQQFFWKFMTNPKFQNERIKFPLTYITWKELPGEKIDTIKIEKREWTYDSFYINSASERTQIYDNFDLKFQPTNERLLHWYGVETGGDSRYFFKGYEGKWFLIKKEQLGD